MIAARPGALEPALAERAHAALANAAAPRWLADGTAADLPFSPELPFDQSALTARLRAALDAPVDVVVQTIAHRKKRLLLADMDSTMIGQECIDELADYV
ncbi:MAG TPA: phosphoserine phosphatase SerB, partial [Pseudolabrys sp.]|nr:phosphoserine phosphatase SerB [Pseudolabrys sp.]